MAFENQSEVNFSIEEKCYGLISLQYCIQCEKEKFFVSHTFFRKLTSKCIENEVKFRKIVDQAITN